jgi:hypothetical protein
MPIYGHRARIGYTSPPAATEVFPYEFYKIVPDGVTLVVHTLPLVERNSEEVDRSYEASLRAAHVMARAGVDILCFGGLPINVSRGFANVDDLIAETEKEVGVPITTSFHARPGRADQARQPVFHGDDGVASFGQPGAPAFILSLGAVLPGAAVQAQKRRVQPVARGQVDVEAKIFLRTATGPDPGAGV